jgi:hypothetical protein
MFGYLSSNKGHTDALQAMQYLPHDHKLLIFGRQHPQTLSSSSVTDSYLQLLIDIIKKDYNLKTRVFFLGELSDNDFLQVASSVDVAWLPYYETGQDGSGIAAICMDICQRVLCSTSFAFDELFKLIPYPNMMRFDVGNFMEIATKTHMIRRRDVQPRPNEDRSLYNTRTQALAYVKDLPKAYLADPVKTVTPLHEA